MKNSCFLNIVEELEQNLYPISQKAVLFELLEFANLLATNKIIITTHSPYLINYLSLAIKAHEVWGLVQKATDVEKHRNSIESVVPIASCIDPKDVAIYECSPEGTIILLPDYHGIPSDDNSLNHILGESNDLFDKLIDVQQSL